MKEQQEFEDMDTQDDDSEYQDWEFEYSQNVAEDFLDQEILKSLDYFDNHNSDENYVPGMATFTLFVRLGILLAEDGYSLDDLKSALDDTVGMVNTETLH